jgi:hypothetical protein
VEHALKRNKLDSGELVFTDQYKSRLPGRVFGKRGSSVTSQKYKGANLFCDTASGRVRIYNQVFFYRRGDNHIQAELKCEAMGTGVQVKDYSSDIGVYFCKEFMRELHTKEHGDQAQLSWRSPSQWSCRKFYQECCPTCSYHDDSYCSKMA